MFNRTGKDGLSLSRKSFPISSFNSALNDGTHAAASPRHSCAYRGAAVKSFGVLFFYAGLMFNFVLLVYQLAQEKEKKLKQGMRLMGLKGKVFWLSWFITSCIMVFITTILLQCAFRTAGEALPALRMCARL